MKYVQKHILKEHLCALQVFFCELISRLCSRVHAHSLEGTMPATKSFSSLDSDEIDWGCRK